ncbi:hypothetical protein BYT27DRAFT_7334412, partial [Phlegmacium glaucopus]
MGFCFCCLFFGVGCLLDYCIKAQSGTPLPSSQPQSTGLDICNPSPDPSSATADYTSDPYDAQGQRCHDLGLTRSNPDPSSSDLTLIDGVMTGQGSVRNLYSITNSIREYSLPKSCALKTQMDLPCKGESVLEVGIYNAGSELFNCQLLEGSVWVKKQSLHDSVYITQSPQIFDNDDGVKDAEVDSVGVDNNKGTYRSLCRPRTYSFATWSRTWVRRSSVSFLSSLCPWNWH